MIETSLGEKVNTYYEYLRSRHWSETRDRILAERGRECEVCFSTDRIHVHHLHYENIGYEQDADLQVLCATCHADAHDTMDEARACRTPKVTCLGDYLRDKRTVPL